MAKIILLRLANSIRQINGRSLKKREERNEMNNTKNTKNNAVTEAKKEREKIK